MTSKGINTLFASSIPRRTPLYDIPIVRNQTNRSGIITPNCDPTEAQIHSPIFLDSRYKKNALSPVYHVHKFLIPTDVQWKNTEYATAQATITAKYVLTINEINTCHQPIHSHLGDMRKKREAGPIRDTCDQ